MKRAKDKRTRQAAFLTALAVLMEAADVKSIEAVQNDDEYSFANGYHIDINFKSTPNQTYVYVEFPVAEIGPMNLRAAAKKLEDNT